MADANQEAVKETAKKQKGNFSLGDVYSDYKEAAEKAPSGEVLVNLLDSIDVEFTSDFKKIKKGTKLTGISRVAYDLYDKNGVVKLLAERKGPTDAELDKAEE